MGRTALGAHAANILKKRGKFDKPILRLLGEKESGVQKISETLTKQSQLISHLEYVAQVDNFAKAALRQSGDVATVKLGGFLSFLPKQEVKMVKGKLQIDAGENLFELTEKAAGSFAKSNTMLKDIYTSPQFYRYIDRGIDYWTPQSAGGQLLVMCLVMQQPLVRLLKPFWIFQRMLSIPTVLSSLWYPMATYCIWELGEQPGEI